MNTATTEAPSTAVAVAAAQEARARKLITFVNGLVIADNDDYAMAGEEVSAVKDRIKAIEEERVKITGPLNAALQAANDLFRGPRTLLESAEGILKAKMLAYRAAEQKKADEARRAAEAIAQAERDRLEVEARELAAAGQQEEAQAALALREVIVAAPPAVAAPKAKGASVAVAPDGAVTDKRAYLLFTVAQLLGSNNLRDALLEMARMSVEGKFEPVQDESQWLELWNPDAIKLRKHVAAKREHLNWPGVTVGTKETMRVR